jgi:hypothetical protein
MKQWKAYRYLSLCRAAGVMAKCQGFAPNCMTFYGLNCVWRFPMEPFLSLHPSLLLLSFYIENKYIQGKARPLFATGR